MTKKSLHRKSGKFQKNPRISVKNKRPKIREILTYFVYAKGKCTIEFLFVFQPRKGRKSSCERTRFLYAVTCKGRDFTDFSLRDITRYSLWLLHPFVFYTRATLIYLISFVSICSIGYCGTSYGAEISLDNCFSAISGPIKVLAIWRIRSPSACNRPLFPPSKGAGLSEPEKQR